MEQKRVLSPFAILANTSTLTKRPDHPVYEEIVTDVASDLDPTVKVEPPTKSWRDFFQPRTPNHSSVPEEDIPEV